MISIFKDRGTSASKSQRVPAGTFIQHRFVPLAGEAVVSVVARADQEDIIDVHDPQTGIHLSVQNVRVDVTLIGPDGKQKAVSQNLALPRPSVAVEALRVQVPAALENGKWALRVRNVGPNSKSVECSVSVEFEEIRTPLFGTPIPLRVLNNALRQLLFGLAVQVRLDGNQGRLTLSRNLEELVGEANLTHRFGLPRDFVHDVNLRSLTVRAATRGGIRPGTPGPFLRIFIEFETIGDTEVQIGPTGADLTAASIEVDVHLRTVSADGRFGKIVPRFSVRENIDFEVGRLAKVALFLAEVVTGNDLRAYIQDAAKAIESTLNLEVSPLLSPYLTEGFLQISSRKNSFHKLTVADNSFIVSHFDPDFRPSTASDEDTTTGLIVNHPFEGDEPVIIGPPGLNEPLRRLSNINTFVVLMQENRSFDHMLGYLSLEAGREDIEGLRGGECNTAPGDLVNGINKLRDTRFTNSPAHEHDPVKKQIADGAMSGFLSSFREAYPHAELAGDNPDRESPLSFYDGQHLPVFDFLAQNFLICNRWFCTFPGATQPNRYCTLNGFTPILENLDVRDPRMGYLTERTIFDRLPKEVDWVYYENDVSTLRFYDRYRLDDRHVIPFDDPIDGFITLARTGGLPPVVFIDPDFVDVPAGKVANDDHPPADVADGQRLIDRIYRACVGSPQWSNMMLIITYDEHGGFYDHVPPPGTTVANAPAVDAGLPMPSVSRVHPDGPDYLGVRVPSFVISPWVDPGVASDVTLDHTSIGKTILLRFRGEGARLPSKRMSETSHLGQLLRAEPRTDKPLMPAPAADDTHDEIGIPPGGAVPIIQPHDKDDFHEAIRQFGRPLPRAVL